TMDVAVNLGDLQRLQGLAATKARVENKLTGFAEQPQPPPDCRQTVPVMKGGCGTALGRAERSGPDISRYLAVTGGIRPSQSRPPTPATYARPPIERCSGRGVADAT